MIYLGQQVLVFEWWGVEIDVGKVLVNIVVENQGVVYQVVIWFERVVMDIDCVRGYVLMLLNCVELGVKLGESYIEDVKGFGW